MKYQRDAAYKNKTQEKNNNPENVSSKSVIPGVFNVKGVSFI